MYDGAACPVRLSTHLYLHLELLYSYLHRIERLWTKCGLNGRYAKGERLVHTWGGQSELVQ